MAAILGVVETSLYVDDLDRVEAFYAGVLGLERLGREAGRHVFFKVGRDNVLLLFHAPATLQGDHVPAHGAAGPGHCALGIPAGAVEEWRERLRAHGVGVEHEERWPLGGHSLYFRDPAGNSVELITPGVWGLPSGW
jgi:catechol 2,3-dioxygenase-like lactoylglutathione lyase family enzyme